MAEEEKEKRALDYINNEEVGLYVEKAIDLKNWDKWGNSPNDIVSTDITTNYILSLLRERKLEDPSKNYVMTEGVTVDVNQGKGLINNRSNIAQYLVKTYDDIYKTQAKTIIYTVLTTQGDFRSSHQNWLCLDFYEGVLYRFEPSKDYSEFQTRELCEEITKKLNFFGHKIRYKMINKPLNIFSGCRAVSTLLAGAYLMNIDLKKLDVLYKVPGKVPLIKPLIYLLQHEMVKCSGISFRANTRKKKELSYVVI
jgi:hypothetical protein